MRIWVFLNLLFIMSCDKIPEICDDLGYAEVPEMSDGFYMRGTLNGEYWEADYAEFTSVIYRGLQEFDLGGIVYNECGIPYYRILLLSKTDSFDFNRIVNEESSYISYNYGQIDESVTTPSYDSLIVSNDFENFIEFDYVAPDTSMIEGRFQIYITKRFTYYEEGEPNSVRIEDGEFRLERTF